MFGPLSESSDTVTFLVGASAAKAAVALGQQKDGSSGSGGPKRDPNFAKVTTELAVAHTVAEAILKNNKDCADLMGHGTASDGTTVSPDQVLASLYSNGHYGSIDVVGISSPPNTTVSAKTEGVSVSNAQTGVSWDAASIKINDLVGTFVTGSAEDQVVTLLHEVAHAMNS